MTSNTDNFDLKSFLRNLTSAPGVYLMQDSKQQVIYIGKAKNLKRRVNSYFNRKHADQKTDTLVTKVAKIEIIVTQSEKEALLLEVSLIKQYKPKYNVVLRDDKSYPYILLTQHKFPSLKFHRGAKRAKGEYFGPYPNARAVRDSILLMQKIFNLRSCDDAFFNNRSRPCLQYQIKRCKAPCVNFITEKNYAHDVKLAKLFLQGKNQQIIHDLEQKMTTAATELEYEQAAVYRDQLQQLRQMQTEQIIYSNVGDVDVLGLSQDSSAFSVCVLMVRHGKILGTKCLHSSLEFDIPAAELLEDFVAQFYLRPGANKDIPKKIVLPVAVTTSSILAAALTDLSNHKVQFQLEARGTIAKLKQMAALNASANLEQRQASRTSIKQKLQALQQQLNLNTAIERIECFDISHSQGEATVASCVVFGTDGPSKAEYRRFNIRNITPGDDYAAMHQALSRCYQSKIEQQKPLPQILLIDGGKGQLTQAQQVLAELNLQDQINLIAIAKGPNRKAGLETLFLDKNSIMDVPADSMVLHLLQQVRDEAHRFAISSHRKQRDKKRTKSKLDAIPGLGPKRRQALLRRFGSVAEIAGQSVTEIAKTKGISKELAQIIFDELH